MQAPRRIASDDRDQGCGSVRDDRDVIAAGQPDPAGCDDTGVIDRQAKLSRLDGFFSESLTERDAAS